LISEYALHKHCVQCEGLFCADDMIFYTDNGYGQFICQKCSERKTMPNIKITAEVDGKIVPLNTISTESFEAIKALEKPKEIPVPVARLATHCYDNDRLILRIDNAFRDFVIGNNDKPVIVIDLKTGGIVHWGNMNIYKNVKPL